MRIHSIRIGCKTHPLHPPINSNNINIFHFISHFNMSSATHYQKPKKEKRKKTRLQREKERSQREIAAGHHGHYFSLSPWVKLSLSLETQNQNTIAPICGSTVACRSLSLSPSQFLSPYRSSLSLSRSHLQPSFCFVFYGLLLCVAELLLKCEIK